MTQTLKEKLGEKVGTLCSSSNMSVALHLSSAAYGRSNGNNKITCPDNSESGLAQLSFRVRAVPL